MFLKMFLSSTVRHVTKRGFSAQWDSDIAEKIAGIGGVSYPC